MKRCVVACAVALSLVFSTTAFAGPEWCSEDPVFSVAGSEVDITTGFSWADLPSAQSATFELQVPSNVLAAQVTIPGTVPIYTTISPVLPAWTGGDIPVVALVTVQGSKNFDISTQITGMYGTLASWTPGNSNKTQKISFSLLHP
jgi:hypothetical protein